MEKSSYEKKMRLLVYIETEFLKYTEKSSLQIIEKIQREKVKRILKSAMHVPYWSNYVYALSSLSRKIKSIKEIEQLPIVTRKDIQNNFSKGRLTNKNIPTQRRVLSFTSGSTGEPLQFFLDTIIAAGRRARYQRMVQWFAREKDFIAIRALGTPPFGFKTLKNVLFVKIDSRKMGDVYFSYFCRHLRNIQRLYQKRIIVDMFPSNVMRLAPLLRRSGVDVSRILGFVSGGESLLPGERAYIKKELACDIWGHYASTEFEIIAQECGYSPTHSYHINSEYFYIEIVDKDGAILSAGKTGRIIITSLEHEVTPFLRYDTGDMGRLLKEQCPCGKTLPLILVEGRCANLIHLPEGKTLTQFSILNIFYNIQLVNLVRQFQLIHEKPDVMTVKIVPHYSSSKKSLDVVRKKLEEVVGNKIKISVVTVDAIPAGKNGKRLGYISKF